MGRETNAVRAVTTLLSRTGRSDGDQGRALARLRCALPALLACALAWGPDPAVGQEKTPTPSAEELWNAYPLQPTPEPTATTAQSPAAQEREVIATAPSTDDGGSLVPPLIAGLVLALGALALLATFRPGRARRSRVAKPVTPRASLTPATTNGTGPVGATHAARAPQPAPRARATQGPARPRRAETLLNTADRPDAGARQAAHPARPAPAAATTDSQRAVDAPRAVPPDSRRRWSAEIAWIGPESHFAVLARPGDEGDPIVVARSPTLEWPPTNAVAVQALTESVAELEQTLLTAGWTALEAASAWYAKRFAWKPVTAPAPGPAARAAPRAALPAPDRQQTRFVRQPTWPAGSDRLWRCELRWDAGVVNSRFEAVAYEPGSERRTRHLGSSATFKWLMMADPNPAANEYRKELRQLAGALQAAGWEHVGRGAKWYAARFIWRRDGVPPDQVESRVPESGQVRD